MPIEVWYILALLAVISVTFLLLKRPIYECMFYGYVLMVILTGEYAHFFSYIGKTTTDTLFYAIIAFLVLAKILDATHAIDSVVNVIVAVLGRFRGGAAYTAAVFGNRVNALFSEAPTAGSVIAVILTFSFQSSVISIYL